MDPGYAAAYRELYQKHWWWRAREAAIVDLLRRERPASGWGHILDVGCGDGLFFDRLAEFGEAEGVEPTATLVDTRGPHRQRIHICPFDENFRPDKAYGLILMLDVLEHLPDPASALRHALSLLEPKGRVLITVPAFNLLWTNHDDINHHLARYTKSSFAEVASRSGLHIERTAYWFHWTFPVKLVQRLAENVLRRPPANPGIPSPFVNRALYLLSRLEQKTLSALPVPFGSSLMVWGRK